jgi:hypothetical protein
LLVNLGALEGYHDVSGIGRGHARQRPARHTEAVCLSVWLCFCLSLCLCMCPSRSLSG